MVSNLSKSELESMLAKAEPLTDEEITFDGCDFDRVFATVAKILLEAGEYDD